MAIFNPVIPIFQEILELPNFMESPIMCLGVQDIEKGDHIPQSFKFDTFGDLCRARGIVCDELDPFDIRAKYDHNLNEPVHEKMHEKYNTLLDYGCIEHIFDTKMVLQNCMNMVKVGGYYAIHTPVRNFAGHGIYTFSPELFPRIMEANGFEVIYFKMTNSSGVEFSVDDHVNEDLIGWIVGKKLKSLDKFVTVEQERYDNGR